MLCRSSQHPTLILASQNENEYVHISENVPDGYDFDYGHDFDTRYANTIRDLLVLHNNGFMLDSHRKETLNG